MSYLFPFGSKTGSKYRSAKILFVASALCSFSFAQGKAAQPALTIPSRTAASKAVVHRSIWAIKWAAAHPAEEEAYLARVSAEGRKVREATKPSGRVSDAVVAANSGLTSVNTVSLKTASFSPDATSQPSVAAQPPVAANADADSPLYSGSERQRRSADNQEASLGDVTLDFVDADISDVLKALAVQTGANIVSSTDVKGSITVSLAHVTLEQALDMIARLSGYQYAKVGSTYVVGSATGIAALVGAGEDQTPVTTVVTFNYASADDLVNALKDRFPDLKVSEGTAIAGNKAGSQAKALILSGDPSTVAQARDLITQIDASLGVNVEQQTTVVYRVQYTSLSDLISILGSLVPSVIVTPGPSQGFTAKAPSASASSASSSSSPSSSSGGATPSATGTSQSVATGPNLLLLTGTTADVARAQQILSEVDVQPAQIDFETKVTEITTTNVNNLGLNWDFSGFSTRIGEEPDNIANPPAVLGANNQTNLLSFGVIGRTAISDMATITMDALIQDGDAKLLADPNISALDGQPAQVFIGNTVNYVESITQTTTGQNITTASVQVGVILRVTGKVDSDGYITLNIHPEVSEITGYLSVPGGGSLPQIASRYADTTIRVKDGETIAIGGLIQENDTSNINKVPGLGDLPFVGRLFQDSQVNKQRTEVVFFLTTKLVS